MSAWIISKLVNVDL